MDRQELEMLRYIESADHYVEDAYLASIRCRAGHMDEAGAERAIQGLLSSKRIEHEPAIRKGNGDRTSGHYRITAWGRMSL